MKKQGEMDFSQKFYFEHKSGQRLYPVTMKNRDTGRVAFRVSKLGNLKEDGLEVDEDEMVQKVLEEGYAVRMTTLDRSISPSLYRPDGHSILRVVKIS